MVWLSGLSVSLQTKGSPVQFSVRAHAWVTGQFPSWGCAKGNYTLMFLSLYFSPPSPLSKNKLIKYFLNNTFIVLQTINKNIKIQLNPPTEVTTANTLIYILQVFKNYNIYHIQ